MAPLLNGWQLLSLNDPSVVARTCANTNGETVLLAKRSKFLQFHAGIVLVKIHGSGPKSITSSFGTTPYLYEASEALRLRVVVAVV